MSCGTYHHYQKNDIEQIKYYDSGASSSRCAW